MCVVCDVWCPGSLSFLYCLYKLTLLLPLSSTAVHVVLQDLLPDSVYFRFNPELSEDISIDERRPQKLELMSKDASSYLARERERMEKAAVCLMQQRTAQQKTLDWFDEMRNKAVSTAWQYRASRRI